MGFPGWLKPSFMYLLIRLCDFIVVRFTFIIDVGQTTRHCHLRSPVHMLVSVYINKYIHVIVGRVRLRMSVIKKFASLVLVASAVAVAGCGTGESRDLTETETGVFLDSPVINIGYRTETKEGVTNAAGEYDYLPGETVTFFIGDLVFPPVPAEGIVTPLDIAQSDDTSDDAVVNIIRLLQTLDKDGDPENGITITEDAKAEASEADIYADPAAFASAVSDLIQNGGQDVGVTELISAEDAIDHFESQLEELEDSGFVPEPISIVGTWNLDAGGGAETDVITIAFFEDGTYLHFEVEGGSDGGLEWGEYSINQETREVTINILADFNGDIGLSDFDGGADKLFAEDRSDDVLTLRVDEDGGSEELEFEAQASGDPWVGVWANTTSENDVLVLVFNADGTYFHAEIDTDDESELSGMEWGTYSRNATSGILTLAQYFDENGDTGLSGFNLGWIANIRINVEGDVLTAQVDEPVDGNIDETILFDRL